MATKESQYIYIITEDGIRVVEGRVDLSVKRLFILNLWGYGLEVGLPAEVCPVYSPLKVLRIYYPPCSSKKFAPLEVEALFFAEGSDESTARFRSILIENFAHLIKELKVEGVTVPCVKVIGYPSDTLLLFLPHEVFNYIVAAGSEVAATILNLFRELDELASVERIIFAYPTKYNEKHLVFRMVCYEYVAGRRKANRQKSRRKKS